MDRIFLDPENKKIIHSYSDDNVFGKPAIKVAKLEEIVADKFMAISFIRTYPRNRDLFDIWYIANNEKLDLKLVRDTFERKCEYRKLDKKLVYKISSEHLEKFKKYWDAQLVALAGNLPEFKEVVKDLVAYRNKVFKR